MSKESFEKCWIFQQDVLLSYFSIRVECKEDDENTVNIKKIVKEEEFIEDSELVEFEIVIEEKPIDYLEASDAHLKKEMLTIQQNGQNVNVIADVTAFTEQSFLNDIPRYETANFGSTVTNDKVLEPEIKQNVTDESKLINRNKMITKTKKKHGI